MCKPPDEGKITNIFPQCLICRIASKKSSELHLLFLFRTFALISCKNTMFCSLISCNFSVIQSLIPFLELRRMGVTPKGKFRFRMRILDSLQVVKPTIHIDIFEATDRRIPLSAESFNS